MHDPATFLAAVLALLATPGPTNTLLAASGALAGARRAAPLVAAELAGYAAAIAALRLLLGPALAARPEIATGLRVAVAAYLLWTAVALWRRRDRLADAGAPVGFGRVFVATLLNPKAAVFAFGIIPFGAPVVWPHLAAFALCVVAAGGGWIALGATLGGLGRGSVGGAVPRVSAVALAAFAAVVLRGG
jgi:threonine/homoserine/homoserine lactone efflux protein